MYKQVFPHPLTPQTPDLTCGHNHFTHRVFPRLVRQNGLTAIEELEESAHSASALLAWAFSLTNEMLPLTDETAPLNLRDISVTLERVNESSLVIVTLTKPKETIGTYLIGLLAPPPSPTSSDTAIRYFTLERATSRRTALCEWVAEGEENFMHRYLAAGPTPTERLFAQAITQFLEMHP